MAEAEGMSQSAVSRIWRAFGLKPHIVETWKLPTDPQFVTKVRDVVGIYLARRRTLWSWRQLADVTAPRRSVGWVHAEA
ncbi:hypothetical protein ACGFY7_25955 [Streptomyces prunicolor]|uniref:hypothetical protein n=1 Tax=Streptomyces prunicolor TaxID=67348 RepID=UPI003713EC9E